FLPLGRVLAFFPVDDVAPVRAPLTFVVADVPWRGGTVGGVLTLRREGPVGLRSDGTRTAEGSSGMAVAPCGAVVQYASRRPRATGRPSNLHTIRAHGGVRATPSRARVVAQDVAGAAHPDVAWTPAARP